MNPFDPFDILDQLHSVEPSEELLKAERELQEDSDRGVDLVATLIVAAILGLIALACWAGWRW